MGIIEILAILTGATKLATTAADIISKMSADGRTKPTPAEVQRLKAEQAEADEGWAAVLEKLRGQQ